VQLKAVHVGHVDVRDDKIKAADAQFLQCGNAVFGFGFGVAPFSMAMLFEFCIAGISTAYFLRPRMPYHNAVAYQQQNQEKPHGLPIFLPNGRFSMMNGQM